MIIVGASLCHAYFANHFVGGFLRGVGAHWRVRRPAAGRLHSALSAVAIIARYRHSISVLMEIHHLWHILTPWPPGTWMLLSRLKWDLIGQLLSQLLLLKSFIQVALWSLLSFSRTDVSRINSSHPASRRRRPGLKATLSNGRDVRNRTSFCVSASPSSSVLSAVKYICMYSICIQDCLRKLEYCDEVLYFL